MAISFPSTPVVNDTYRYLDREWIWNGSGWAWFLNNGQAGTSFFRVSSTVTGINELAGGDLANSTFLNLDYV